ACAAIRNEVHLLAGQLLEQNAANVCGGVLVDEVDLARVRLHPGDEVLEIVGGEILFRDHQLRIVGDEPDRLEILLQVVVGLVDDAAHVRIPLADVNRVGIRRGARDASDRDGAPGAAPVFRDGPPPPRGPPMRAARMGGATSVEPPGGKGTMRVIWRDGYVCACACAQKKPASAASASATKRFRMFPPAIPPVSRRRALTGISLCTA